MHNRHTFGISLTQKPQHAMQADVAEHCLTERYVFCQRGELVMGERLLRIRTQDVSLGGFGIVADDPIRPGSQGILRFSTIIGTRIEAMHFTCVARSCILNGMSGYRIGLQIIEKTTATQTLLKGLTDRCASLYKLG